MAELRWTEEALIWLEDIFEHIAAEDPEAAARVVNGIYERSQVLLDHPQIGYRYQASTRHVRVLPYGHYRIAYLVRADAVVDVLGVFHGALDLRRYQL